MTKGQRSASSGSIKKFVSKVKDSRQVDRAVQELQEITRNLKLLARRAKQKFDQVDEQTKKKVIAGITGAAAVLLAASKLKRARKKKQANEKKQ